MRSIARSLGIFASAAIVATCADSPSVAPRPGAGKARAQIALVPVFSDAARAVLAQRTAFAAVNFDHVHIVLTRPNDNTVVLDTTIVFSPDAPDVTLNLSVDIAQPDQVFGAAIDYTNAGAPVFHGTVQVQAHAPDAAAPPQQQVVIVYVGPGAAATRVAVTPKLTSIVAPGTVLLTATAFDASNVALANVPFAWTSSDPSVASVSPTGLMSPTGKRGTVTITATIPTGLSDGGTIQISLPASNLVLVSGGGQTGKAGSALSQPAVVRAVATDGVGVPGISVNFAPPAGGKVGASTVVTDGNGAASTTMTLGSAIGSQGFAAVAGGFSVGIPATATPADPATIAIVSGSGQKDTVKRALKPFVVKVTDQFGNPVDKVTVTWTRVSGSGAVGAATSTTGPDGTTSMTYTLGSVAGAETITATAQGAGSATFAAQAVSGLPFAIAIVSGGDQTGRVLETLAGALVVKVTDDAGNPVNNGTVAWAATNGTISAQTTIGDNGQSSNTLTLGDKTGPAAATASIATAGGTKTVTFNALVGAGTVSKIAFQATPAGGAAGSVLSPTKVELRDAGGNLTGATNAVTIALGANPSGATLTGTLSRNAVAGVATFDDLKIDKTGTGYALVATSGGVPSITSAAFNVQSGNPQTLVVVSAQNQSAPVGTAVAVPPSVKVVDGSSNPVSGVAVTFTPNAGSGTVAPTTPVVSDAGGIATLTSWTLGAVAGPQTVVASVNKGAATVAINATATAGAPAQLMIVTQPPSAAQSGVALSTSTVIQLQDAGGNPVTQSGVMVSASIASGSGTLAGTTSAATGVLGRATFSNLIIHGTVGSFTLSFVAQGAPAVASSAIALAPGPAALLAFVQQPSATVAGNPIAPAITVRVKDADQNDVTSTASIAMAITPNTGTAGAVLSGTNPVAAVAGVATFGNLKIDKVGAAYMLTATSNGLGAAVSTQFNITTGSAASLTILSGNNQYFPDNYGATRGSLTVIVKDGSGNPVPGVQVTFTAGAGATVNSQPSFVQSTSASGTASASMGITALTGSGTVTASVQNAPPVTFNAVRTNQGPWSTSCTLTSTNDAYCWGDNSHGQVGDGTTASRNVPVAVIGGVKFASLAPAAGAHQCGLTSGGQAYCWGLNLYGQLGDNSQTDHTQPTLVAGGLTFTSITTSNYSTCGTATGGQLYCWGWTGGGILGDGDLGTIRTVPAAVNTGGRTFTKVVVLDDYACALDGTGAAFCWGQAPDGTHTTATAVPNSPTFISITAGLYHVCGVATGGAGYCWGVATANYGLLGDGTGVARTTPTPVSGGLQFTDIRASIYTNCGVTTSNALYCWGSGGTSLFSGQIGDGANVDRLVPTLVSGGISFSRTMSGGMDHSCAIAVSGQPFCWGSNVGGDLGDGSNSVQLTPVPVKWVEGTPGVARSLVISGGNNGSAGVGSPVSPSPSVLVRDFANNPVNGVTVTFAVGPNSGSATGTSAVTNASGIATVGSWTLGSVGTNTLTATLASVGQVGFTATGAPGQPTVSIVSVNQIVCNPNCTSLPANLNALAGQNDVTVQIQLHGIALTSASAVLTCPGPTSVTASQGLGGGATTGVSTVTLSLVTNTYNAQTGVPQLKNGACTLSVTAATASGSGSANLSGTAANADGYVLNSTFAAITNAEGQAQLTTANDANGQPWHSGSVTVQAIPVIYSGKTIASLAITLPGATTPTQTLVQGPYAATWTGTSGQGPRVTDLTLVDATTCGFGQTPPSCGPRESDGITPKGVTPTVTALDNSGNPITMTLLNPNTPASTFRLDNTAPEAPLAFNIPVVQGNWVNASYAFVQVGAGTNNANVTGKTMQFISCGDGVAPTQNPYSCQPQLGVSASALGQVGVGSAASNGHTSFSFYAIPVANYVPGSATNGTSTSSGGCSTVGWALITTANSLAASATSNAYVVRVFERDLLLNARCIDLAAGVSTAAGLGTIINTGVSNQYATFQGHFGVDKAAPTSSFIDPAQDAQAVGQNDVITTNPVRNFKVSAVDNASGFSQTPVLTTFTRFAIDPNTSAPSTTNSTFGCPLGLTAGVCSPIAIPTVLAADAAGANRQSSGVDGYYTYTGVVTDLAGNLAPSITRTVLVDRTIPIMGGIAVPATMTGGGSVGFATSAADNVDLVSSEYSLQYPTIPSGSGQPFVIRGTGPQLGVAFDNVLTTTAVFNMVVPSFIRNLATTSANNTPQNNGALPSQITGRVYDAAGNQSQPVVQPLSPANIPQGSHTDFSAPQPNGTVIVSFQETNTFSNISNGPPPTVPANPTSVVLTASVIGTESPIAQPANPFTLVSFYYFDPVTTEWQLVGTVAAVTVTDNAQVTFRTFTWSLPFDPPTSLGVGTLRVIAVGTNNLGDGLISAVNANITLTNP